MQIVELELNGIIHFGDSNYISVITDNLANKFSTTNDYWNGQVSGKAGTIEGLFYGDAKSIKIL